MIKSGAKVDCHIVPNGINLTRYQEAKVSDSPITKRPGEKLILCVARLSAEKRQATLIDAMRYVKDKNARLVLVGEGPLDDALHELAESYGVQEKVVFAGYHTPEKIAALMKQADVFALASWRFDNQPMVILEAIASGLPIVYCDNKLKEGLDGDNALLTKGKSGKAFAAAFDQLLKDDERRKEMAKNSRVLSKEFDIERLAQALVGLYQEARDRKALQQK